MYHKLSYAESDGLTVTINQFESQMQYLQTNGYDIISMQELINHITLKDEILAKKPVLITFDDGYVNNLTYLFPYIEKHKCPVTVFLPTAYIGKCNSWDEGKSDIMSWEQLSSAPKEISFGLHSHKHVSLEQLDDAQIKAELEQNMQSFEGKDINFVPTLAYPFGKFPKKRKKQLASILLELGIKAAFRIGNRHNPIPINAPFFIQRLDIRGDRDFNDFTKKIKWGKLF